MRQMVRIVLNNIWNNKFKACMIVIMIAFSMFTSVISVAFKDSIATLVDVKTEELNSNAKIKVMSKNTNGKIALSTLEYVEQMDGVRNVVPQYNIGGLLEKEKGIPIYGVVVNGFDFENDLFVGANDYRNQKASGILLPNIGESMMADIVLQDLVDTEVLFTYEYVQDGNVLSKTITSKVIGVYETTGSFEENPVYMSMDLFSEIQSDYGELISSVSSANVYLDDATYTEAVVQELAKLGLDVYYESTVEEYIESLEGFVTVGIAIVVVALVFAMIIIIQTVLANLRKRYTTIAVMKVYGYSTAAICFFVWLEIFIYCVLAVVVTVIGCLWLQNTIQDVFALFLPGLVFTINKSVIIISLVICAMTSCVCAISPCKDLMRLNPIEVLKSN